MRPIWFQDSISEMFSANPDKDLSTSNSMYIIEDIESDVHRYWDTIV